MSKVSNKDCFQSYYGYLTNNVDTLSNFENGMCLQGLYGQTICNGDEGGAASFETGDMHK